jgi:hypothetical protein
MIVRMVEDEMIRIGMVESMGKMYVYVVFLGETDFANTFQATTDTENSIMNALNSFRDPSFSAGLFSNLGNSLSALADDNTGCTRKHKESVDCSLSQKTKKQKKR